MDIPAHWKQIYASKAPRETSWYAPHLETSFAWMVEAVENKAEAIIDVGGGESTLVDDLLRAGYTNLTVMDIADGALRNAQQRLGAASASVQWLAGDVTTISLPASTYRMWHDRAVFHFLTQPAQRAAYVRQLTSSLKHGGQIVMATFSLAGPLTCSGLDVIRYDEQSLQRELGTQFHLIRSAHVAHQTPSGTTQAFLYCQFRFCPTHLCPTN